METKLLDRALNQDTPKMYTQRELEITLNHIKEEQNSDPVVQSWRLVKYVSLTLFIALLTVTIAFKAFVLFFYVFTVGLPIVCIAAAFEMKRRTIIKESYLM